MPPHTNTVTAQKSQDGEDRRTCRVCRQTKALSEFSLKNGRHRRVCKLCRLTRAVRQREEDREKQIKRCFLALGREIRRGRGNHKRAAELLEELQTLCGGNLSVVADRWGDFLKEGLEKRPGTPRTLKGLIAMMGAIRLAQKAETVPAAPPARKPRHREKPPDFAAWSDEQLQEAIEAYERQQTLKRNRRGGSQRKTHDSARNGPVHGPEGRSEAIPGSFATEMVLPGPGKDEDA